MSSTQRFLKQIPANNSVFAAAQGGAASGLYEFVAASGNVVGNYPPGYVQAITNSSVVTAINALGNPVLRDMGKTIFAQIGTSGNYGRFRQVQVLGLGPITAATGFNGGVNGTTFGVNGTVPGVDANVNYLTVYVPVPVGGVLAGAIYNNDVLSGGSM
jgi:hypothetical protein